MKIKTFLQFNEAISGTELVGNVAMGPAYGETRLQNKTINTRHTQTSFSKNTSNPNSKNELTNDIFFEDEYDDVFVEFIKNGGNQSDLSDDRGLNMKIMTDFLHNR